MTNNAPPRTKFEKVPRALTDRSSP